MVNSSKPTTIKLNSISLSEKANVRLPVVMKMTGFGRTKIYSDAKKGLFFPPIRVSFKTSVWPLAEIIAFNSWVVAGKTQDEIRALIAEAVANRKASH